MTIKKSVAFAGLSLAPLYLSLACAPHPSSAEQRPPAAPEAAAPLETSNPNIFVKLAKKVVPSVVNISTAKLVKSPFTQSHPDDIYRRFFEDFFGPGGPGGPGGPHGFGGPNFGPGGPRPRSPRPAPKSPDSKGVARPLSLGTGFVVDASGLILTNNHVVAEADEIKIQFTEDPNEKPTDGEVVGRDAELDVALIRVKGKKDLVALPLGDSDSIEVGEYVVAVGNPFGQGHSVTHGIISAKERSVPGLGAGLANYLQTDAPINPGNSGGPLINLKGEVIGINNAIDARAQGIGFAIPISSVKRILTQLKSRGSVERGYIGALIGEVTPELAEKLGVDRDLRAPFVTNVEPDGPADRGGVKPYDVVLKVNGKPVSSTATLIAAITAIPVGETAKLDILREGKNRQLSVKVAKRPTGEAKEEAGPSPKNTPPAGTPELGADIDTLTPELAQRFSLPPKTSGVVVTSVDPDGPAAQAGLSPGDVILEVDRKAVSQTTQFFSLIREKKSYLLRVLKTGSSDARQGYAVVVLDLKEK